MVKEENPSINSDVRRAEDSILPAFFSNSEGQSYLGYKFGFKLFANQLNPKEINF